MELKNREGFIDLHRLKLPIQKSQSQQGFMSWSSLIWKFSLLMVYQILFIDEISAVPGDVKILISFTSKSKIFTCFSDHNAGLQTYWVKATGFDSFDDTDISFTGTGVIRTQRGTGCRLAIPNTWYWMGIMANRIGTTNQCNLNVTLREPGAADNGDCGSSPGTNFWDLLVPSGEVTFYQEYTFANPLTTGNGQFYGLSNNDYHFNGKDLSDFILGIKWWHTKIQYYNHFSPAFTSSWESKNAHMDKDAWTERFTRNQIMGMAIDHVPLTGITSYYFGNLRSTMSYAAEFVITKLDQFEYSPSGKRKLIFKIGTSLNTNLVQEINVEVTKNTNEFIFDITLTPKTNVLVSSTHFTGQVTLSHSGVTYLIFYVSFGIRPFDGSTTSSFYLKTDLKFDNGSTMASFSKEIQGDITNAWSSAMREIVSAECEDITTATNCSTTHDFGLVRTTDNYLPGTLEYDQFNSIFLIDYPESEKDKCWVPHGYDNSGATSPIKCGLCKLIRSRNSDGTFLYRVQNGKLCIDDTLQNTYPSNTEIENCELGNSRDASSCDACKSGYSLNLNWFENQSNGSNCVPEAECTSTSAGSHFTSVTFENGQTKKYCDSCSSTSNCLNCEANGVCTSCQSWATLNSGVCECQATNCSNCTSTMCSVCTNSDSEWRHIEQDGVTINCLTGTVSNQNCTAQYGRVVGEVVTDPYTHTCRKCQIQGCEVCKTDYTVCETCLDPYSILPNGQCIPSLVVECQAPEKLYEPTSTCLDCSLNFDSIEESNPGFCSGITKDYYWVALNLESRRELKRRFKVRSF